MPAANKGYNSVLPIQKIEFLTFNLARFRTEKSLRISQTEIIALTLPNIKKNRSLN